MQPKREINIVGRLLTSGMRNARQREKPRMKKKERHRIKKNSYTTTNQRTYRNVFRQF